MSLSQASDYTKIRQIGSGSFGTAHLVYRASEGPAALQLVLKEVNLMRQDSLQKTAAEVEVKVLSSLKHPYIVKYHESFVRNSVLSIVMDYCEAGDLHQYVARQRTARDESTQAQVIRWFTQLCLALKYLHDKNILHRDIKSQNVFLTRYEHSSLMDLRLADFGIAKVLKDHTMAKTQIGTPYYLSPEICRAQPYSCPSDMWATGCVLYEMSTLRLPFTGSCMEELREHILRGRLPRLPARFPSGLVEINADLLKRMATARPSAAAVLQRPVLQDEIERLLATAKDKVDKEAEPATARPLTGPGELLCGGRMPARPLIGARRPLSAAVRDGKPVMGGEMQKLGSFKDKVPEPLQEDQLRIQREPLDAGLANRRASPAEPRVTPPSQLNSHRSSSSPAGTRRPMSRRNTAQEIVKTTRPPSGFMVRRLRSESVSALVPDRVTPSGDLVSARSRAPTGPGDLVSARSRAPTADLVNPSGADIYRSRY